MMRHMIIIRSYWVIGLEVYHYGIIYGFFVISISQQTNLLSIPGLSSEATLAQRV